MDTKRWRLARFTASDYRHPIRAAVAAWIGLTLAACATAHWRSEYGRNHRLAGRVWDVAAATFIEPEVLFGRLAGADFILLGEKHDNPDHHRLQALVLRRLIAAGRRPALGFEMLSVDDDAAIAAAPSDAAGFGRALRWQERGWPDWSMYQPIAEAALAAKLRIVGANIPLDAARKLAKLGIAALEPSAARRLGVDQPLPSAAQAAMTDVIRSSHCGFGSDEGLKGMVLAQRARDAQMALSLIDAGGNQGAVLIAGAGHVRKDYGVPAELVARRPNSEVKSVAFVEVADPLTAPADYAPSFAEGKLPYDYVWFTPRSDDDDPCERFKSQLERFRK